MEVHGSVPDSLVPDSNEKLGTIEKNETKYLNLCLQCVGLWISRDGSRNRPNLDKVYTLFKNHRYAARLRLERSATGRFRGVLLLLGFASEFERLCGALVFPSLGGHGRNVRLALGPSRAWACNK